jgi:MFS family permease
MTIPVSLDHYVEYFLKRDISKFYIAVAIRNFALGMVLLFEPIYLYLYFGSLALTLVYFASMFGLYGLFVVWGGRFMTKVGLTRSILLSTVFYVAYYVSLQLLPFSFWFVPLSIVCVVIGMMLFWPAFHLDFVRFSSQQTRGGEVGKVNVAMLLPTIISPLLGGIIVTVFGYPVLFTMVFVVLFTSTIPLFYSREHKETYADTYQGAWKRTFEKKYWQRTLAIASDGVEVVVLGLFWPLFLFFAAISFSVMGVIASFALLLSTLFMLYVGKISDTEDRPWLLNVGSLWTAIAWVLKYFVSTAFDALLAHTIYRISRGASTVPFKTFFYEQAAQQGDQADEFIVSREISIALARFAVLNILAGIFFVFPEAPLQIVFLFAALLSLGFMLLGKLPKFSFSDI